MTEELAADGAGIARAAALLRAGRLVAFPTETVYGLGALATHDGAVAAIFEAKGRPAFNPLIVHVRDLDGALALAEMTEAQIALAGSHWPGPLTLVAPVRRGSGLSPLVTAGGDHVGLRVPDQTIALALLAAVNGPVAAPSANPSGRISPTTAAHVRTGLDGRIAAILDGGATEVGVESTILGPDLALLRPGGLAVADLERTIGYPLPAGTDGPMTPGRLASHYAPRGRLRLDATEARADEILIGFGAVAGDVSLSRRGDLTEAAARLFGILHDLDRRGVARIAVAPVPRTGLGLAINDRLERAAAPRS